MSPKESRYGSLVPSRHLGRRMRALREGAALSRRLVSQELLISESSVWRMERGDGPIRPMLAKTLLSMYGAPAEEVGPLLAMSEIARGRGWWYEFRDVIPPWFDLYVGLENEACSQSMYEPALIPGLLQTANYARALFRAANPEWGEQKVKRYTEFRMSRQNLLTRPLRRAQLNVVLDEAVLHQTMGSAAVMAEQLDRLCNMAAWPNITLRVMPLSAGFHLGRKSKGFVLLDFPLNAGGKPIEPPVVYLEGLTGAAYLDTARDIDSHRRAFEQIESVALDPEASRRLLARRAESWDHALRNPHPVAQKQS